MVKSCMLFLVAVSLCSFIWGGTAGMSSCSKCCSREDREKCSEELQLIRRQISFLLTSSGWSKASNGMLYKFFSTKKSWQEANADCESMGALLAVAGMKDYNIRREIAAFADAPFWFGLSDADEEGSWRWLDGTRGSSTDSIWHTGEPNDDWGNEDCAQLYLGSATANDKKCEDDFAYLCEISLLE